MKALKRHDNVILCVGDNIIKTTYTLRTGDSTAFIILNDPVDISYYVISKIDDNSEIIDLDILSNVPNDIYIHSKYKYVDNIFMEI